MGRRMRQKTLDSVLLSQRKAGPASCAKGSGKAVASKVSMTHANLRSR
jgi:hypothetical protein